MKYPDPLPFARINRGWLVNLASAVTAGVAATSLLDARGEFPRASHLHLNGVLPDGLAFIAACALTHGVGLALYRHHAKKVGLRAISVMSLTAMLARLALFALCLTAAFTAVMTPLRVVAGEGSLARLALAAGKDAQIMLVWGWFATPLLALVECEDHRAALLHWVRAHASSLVIAVMAQYLYWVTRGDLERLGGPTMALLTVVAGLAAWMQHRARRWHDDLRSGALAGHALRPAASRDRPTDLPVWQPPYSIETDGVLVREATSDQGTYRGGVVVTPVARVPLSPLWPFERRWVVLSVVAALMTILGALAGR